MTAPRFSRHQINRAGETLASDDASETAHTQAVQTLTEWRALHWYPMHMLAVTLRRHLQTKKKTSLIATRLKRLPTILDKLKNREREMALGRMQDVGGVRAILPSVPDVRALERYCRLIKGHLTLKGSKDYLASPRCSGYRSIHLVYEYHNPRKPELDGLLIELQLRSRLEHLWATAVEAVGFARQEALKSGRGTEEWLTFFKLVSALFAFREASPPPPDFESSSEAHVKEKLSAHIRTFASIDTLRAITHLSMPPSLDTLKKSKYWLIRSDGLHLLFQGFNAATAAFSAYNDLEQTPLNQIGRAQTLLFSVDSVKNIQRAYPNFFLNLTDFLRELNHSLAIP